MIKYERLVKIQEKIVSFLSSPPTYSFLIKYVAGEGCRRSVGLIV
jgi:hypothetical protein